MHPQIVLGEHACTDAMLALIQCHDASVFNRFIGWCNDPAEALEKCLRANKKAKVKASILESREKRRRWEELCVAQGLELGPGRTQPK